jgi:hypothetical protein
LQMTGDGSFIAASAPFEAIAKTTTVAVAIPKSVFFDMVYSFLSLRIEWCGMRC